MPVFHIRYRNAQGALMRILNAVSRRGLDLTSVHAESAGQDYAVTLMLEVTPKQIGQLCREWYAIVDVIECPFECRLGGGASSGGRSWNRWTAASVRRFVQSVMPWVASCMGNLLRGQLLALRIAVPWL